MSTNSACELVWTTRVLVVVLGQLLLFKDIAMAGWCVLLVANVGLFLTVRKFRVANVQAS